MYKCTPYITLIPHEKSAGSISLTAQCTKYKLFIIVLIKLFLEFSNLDLKDRIYFRNATTNGLRPLCIRATDIIYA